MLTRRNKCYSSFLCALDLFIHAVVSVRLITHSEWAFIFCAKYSSRHLIYNIVLNCQKSCNRKRLTDLENKLRVAGGKGYLGTLGRS